MALYETRRRHELRSYRFDAVAASIDGSVFIADKPCILKEVQFVVVVGAATATLDLKKCTGTQAPSAGTTMLATTIDLNSTANTTSSKTLTATKSVLYMQPGDRIGADYTNALTGLSAHVQFVIETI